MTDSPDPHLHDELLSAVLDGEADVEQSTHVDACDACRARLGALRDASALVATPARNADAGRRDAAIAAALAVADGVTGTVVPLRRRRTIPTWLGAAAAVVVAVGAISLLVNRGGETRSADTAVDGDDAGGADAMAEENATAMLVAPVVDGGDLGAIDAASLRETIEGAFAATREAPQEAGEASDAPAPAAEGRATVPCEQEVRAGNPDLGGLVYRASGDLDGTAVVVLAFDVPPDRWVYVVTADGCAIRNQQTYSP